MRMARVGDRTLPFSFWLACLVLLGGWLWTDGLSAAETEPMAALIEWEHPFPAQVAYFRMHFADTEAEMTSPRIMQVGLPGARGRYLWAFSVEPNRSVWVAVEAVGPTGLGSALSEWRRHDWRSGSGPLGLPGRPVRVKSPETAP